jgi:hypothetical protein
MSVVAVQAVFTPASPHVEAAAQSPQGALPVDDHVVPTTHGTSHTVSVVVVHAVFTP